MTCGMCGEALGSWERERGEAAHFVCQLADRLEYNCDQCHQRMGPVEALLEAFLGSVCASCQEENRARAVCERDGHEWAPWHWFITTPGWTRQCSRCYSYEPGYDPERDYLRHDQADPTLPSEGEVCPDCEPFRNCCLSLRSSA